MKRRILSLLLFIAPACFANDLQSTTDINNQMIANNQPPKNHLVKRHPVGSCYGGGVVFYLNKQLNRHQGYRGLIVALEDAYPDISLWDSSGKTPVAAPGTSKENFTGLTNTANILKTNNNTPPSVMAWPPAQLASEYTTSETCDTCTSWYLPSQSELSTLYYQSNDFSGFWNNPGCSGSALKPEAYWSSSQYTERKSTYLMTWTVDFSNGFVGYEPVMFPRRIRAIRAF